jgi:hypothetical protein
VSSIVFEGFVALALVPVPPANGGHAVVVVVVVAVVVGVLVGAVVLVVFWAVVVPPQPAKNRSPAKSPARFMAGI